MRSFHVYCLRDSGAPDENRYIGGAYGNEQRRFAHTATRGAKANRGWIAEAETAGRAVIRKILFTCDTKDDVRWAETATWRAYKALGHRVQEDCPNGPCQAALTNQLATNKRLGYPGLRKSRTAFAENGWPNCQKATESSRSPEARAKRSASHTGKKQNPEHVKKSSDARRGQKRTPEAREKMAAAKRGKKGSPRTSEWLANQSAARKGKALGPQSSEHIERRATSNRGQKRSAETRLKLSTVTQAGWQRPEVRAAHAENQRNQYSGRGTRIARRANAVPIRASR